MEPAASTHEGEAGARFADADADAARATDAFAATGGVQATPSASGAGAGSGSGDGAAAGGGGGAGDGTAAGGDAAPVVAAAPACAFTFREGPVRVAQCCDVFKPTEAQHVAARTAGSCLPANPFVQRVSFSPDGTCLLAASDDNRLRVFEVPPHAFLNKAEAVKQGGDFAFNPVLSVQEGETVYDFDWYPMMHVTSPGSCCFVTTTRERPVHLWDAFTGKLRATYRAYNHLDEIAAALCITFSPDGSRLYGGYNRMVRVFDISRPGRPIHNWPTSKTRRSQHGQRGIISSITFDPTNSGLYAAGSYAGSVYTYDESSGTKVAVMKCSGTGDGLKHGVTQVKFTPNGLYLFAGARRSGDIVCWDVRRPKKELGRVSRSLCSNQRIGFDIDASGTYLVTGSQDRRALVYDVATLQLAAETSQLSDCVSSAAFHPSGGVLALGTGQRHFGVAGDDDDVPPPDGNSVSLWRSDHVFSQ